MKNTAIEIKQITATKTLEIRHKAMWANKPIAYVKLPNDENGTHFGLFVNDEITAVISLFIANNEAQFRKFATLTEFQGLGYGTILLNKVIDFTKEEGIKKIWCNARVEKSKFYEKFNLKATNNKFEKDGIEYVIMERYFCN
ncbi:GNAT family N-acetyltransferase [Tenacibaculum pacificus]|uniref:GNAT family N-acetyltransferase n=1 Tax=Tenacibaculum TaxID=104267 RepID=UPI001F277F97|nr:MULTISPECIES: GNAT family N-acetyltransferase [Tenacibaculum]WBX73234.1 GNAT family N-acetyltransferase [Tenacibaculum pacificus]